MLLKQPGDKVKKILFFITFLMMTTTVVLANWSENFHTIYADKGINEAVKNALSEGANLDQIIKAALPIKSLKEENLIKALFCALAQPDYIREAAKVNQITDNKVDAGYQLALAECAREMEENLNAIVNPTPQFPELSPSKRIRRGVYASPWTFEQ